MIIEIGTFENIGNKKNWAFQNSVHGWAIGYLRTDKDGNEVFQGVAYPVSLLDCVKILWRRLVGEIDDIKLSANDKELAEKLKVIVEVFKEVSVQMDHAMSPFGITVSYNEESLLSGINDWGLQYKDYELSTSKDVKKFYNLKNKSRTKRYRA